MLEQHDAITQLLIIMGGVSSFIILGGLVVGLFKLFKAIVESIKDNYINKYEHLPAAKCFCKDCKWKDGYDCRYMVGNIDDPCFCWRATPDYEEGIKWC